VVLPAAAINNYQRALASVIPGGRLTLSSGVAVPTADVTSTSVHYTAFTNNIISLWDGSDWVSITFGNTTEALPTLVSGRGYDVFAFLNAGAFDMEIDAWASGTARVAPLTVYDGRKCKNSDKTRLWLGSFEAVSTTETRDSEAQRKLYNAYNQVIRSSKSPIGANHTYNSSTLRRWNNGSGTQPEAAFFLGEPVALNFTGQWFATNNGTSLQINATCRLYLDAATDIQGTDSQYYVAGTAVSGAAIGLAAAAYVAEGARFVTIFEAEYSGNNSDYQKAITQVIGLRS
jgi:hypothetical protein